MPNNSVRDLAMLRNPDDWTFWPFLPVKRNGGKELGYILAGELRVYHTNLFSDKPRILEASYTSYESFEALLADGWRVD